MISSHPKRTGRFHRAPLQRAALLVTAMLACAGCSLTAKEDVTASIPTDHRQRHPIAIRDGDHTLEVFVGARRAGLSPSQRTELAGLAAAWRHEATGGIIIDVPAGTPNARAAAATASEIRALLAAAGVPPRAMVARGYRPEDPAQLATVRVHYPKLVAQAGPCGLWPQDLGLSHDASPTQNRPYWNHGCANQRNLASMVANPADLVQPRSETSAYTGRRTIVLDKYRKGESTATTYPEAARGGISDVGR